MARSGVDEMRLWLPREGMTPRHVARPSAVWRLCQEAAVQASSLRGWPPARYTSAGVGFVLARMSVCHLSEVSDTDPVDVRTWVRAFRRRTISEREIRLSVAGQRVLVASQRWVHISAALKITPASAAFASSFIPHDEPNDPSAQLPVLPAAEGAAHTMTLQCWHAWLDVLGHVNHPTYLDWCDEHTARRLAAAGVPAPLLQPVAEQIHYRSGVTAGDPILVRSRVVGASEDGTQVQIQHEIEDPRDGKAYARAVTVRRLADGRPLAPLLL